MTDTPRRCPNSRCVDGWVHSLEPTGAFLKEISGIKERCTNPWHTAPVPAPDYRGVDCEKCGRARVEIDGICEKCRWDNDKHEYAEPASPEPPCPDCWEAAKLAYSDATTTGFFSPRCSKHAAPTGTTRCSCPSRSEPIQHDILCPLHAPTGTPTDRKTLAEVYAHEYAYNLHPDEPSLAALFLKFANDCTSRFAAVPTGTGEASLEDMLREDGHTSANIVMQMAAALRSQLATAQARIAMLENNVQNWRAGLLDAWANDYRATMTALLESNPLAASPSSQDAH